MVVRDQSKPSPESVSLHLKDYMSLVTQSSKDLAIFSDIDWLLAGGTSLLTDLSSNPPSGDVLAQHLALLQRYMLELSRDVEVLERHSTARYANLIWRLRDGYLTRLHPSIPDSLGDRP